VAGGRAAVPESLVSNTCGLVAAWAAGGAVPAAVLRLARGGFSMKTVVLGGVLSLTLAAGVALAAGSADAPASPVPPAADPPPPALAVAAEAEAQPRKGEAPPKAGAPRLMRMEDIAIRQVRAVFWSDDATWLALNGTTSDLSLPLGGVAPVGGKGGPGAGGGGKGGPGAGGRPPGGRRGGGPGGTPKTNRNTIALVSMTDRRTPTIYAPLPTAGRLIGFTPKDNNDSLIVTETHESGLISGAHTVQFWDAVGRPAAVGGQVVELTSTRVFDVGPDAALFTPTPDGKALRYLVRETDKAGIHKVQVRQTDLRNAEDWEIGKFEGTFRTTRFTPDAARVIAVTAETGVVEAYAAADGKRLWASAPAPKAAPKDPDPFGPGRIFGGTEPPTFVAVSRDGSRVLAVRGRSAPVVLDGATGKALPTLDGIESAEVAGTPGLAAVSADGRLTALSYITFEKAGDDAKKNPFGGGGKGPGLAEGTTRLTVWDTATGKVARSWQGGRPLALVFHPTRPTLAILESNGTETRLGLWEFPPEEKR
jgi:hypothetical protein